MLFTNELVPGDPTASLPTSPPMFTSSIESAKWYKELQLISDEVVYRLNRHSENHRHGCRASPVHECRARFPRDLHQFTTVDEATGALVLKKRERWITTFSVPLSYLLRCNTDVTCLLSGTMVRAVIAYVTDYVTKSSLKTHTMFDVIRKAVDDKERYVSDDGDTHVSARKLVTRVVNALTAKTEIGGPLVCCHLLGNPEHYTDRTFKPFFWFSYAKIVALAWNEPFHASDAIQSKLSDKVVITSTPNGLTSYEKVYDYTCRPRSMENMSLVDFLALTNVVLLPRDKRRHESGSSSSESEVGGIESDVNVIGRFLVNHPKYLTHGVYRVEDKFRSVLTYLGPVLPRKDNGDIEFYCRTMLTLFCPWRDGLNLRTDTQTWKEAFDAYPFSERHLRVMQNMNVLYECRDAAHDFAAQRDVRNSALMPNAFDPSVIDDLKQPLDGYDNASMTEVDILSLLELTYNKESSQLVKDQLVNVAKEREFLTLLSFPSVRSQSSQNAAGIGRDSLPVFVSSARLPHEWKDILTRAKDEVIKQRLNPSSLDSHERPNSPSAHDHYDVRILNAIDLEGDHYFASSSTCPSSTTGVSSTPAMREVILSHTLDAAQSRAFAIIASRVTSASATPLRMYLGGMGGTGKSQVIKALLSFFENRHEPHRLRVMAPTGSAAA
jgi:hypothetical protein